MRNKHSKSSVHRFLCSSSLQDCPTTSRHRSSQASSRKRTPMNALLEPHRGFRSLPQLRSARAGVCCRRLLGACLGDVADLRMAVCCSQDRGADDHHVLGLWRHDDHLVPGPIRRRQVQYGAHAPGGLWTVSSESAVGLRHSPVAASTPGSKQGCGWRRGRELGLMRVIGDGDVGVGCWEGGRL